MSSSSIPHVGACWIVSQLPNRSATRDSIVLHIERFGLEILSVNELKSIEGKIYSMDAVRVEPSIVRYSLPRGARKQVRVGFVRRAFYRDATCKVVNVRLLEDLEDELRNSQWTLHGTELAVPATAATATTTTDSSGTTDTTTTNNNNVARASSSTEWYHPSNAPQSNSAMASHPTMYFGADAPDGSSGGSTSSGCGYHIPHVALHASGMSVPPSFDHGWNGLHPHQPPFPTSWEDAETNNFQNHHHHHHFHHPQHLHPPSNSDIHWEEPRHRPAGMTNPSLGGGGDTPTVEATSGNLFSTFSSTNPNGPQNARELCLLQELRAMQFTDVQEVLNGIRHCGQDTTADEVMLYLVTQREEADEARKEDEVRLRSEDQKEEQADRKKKDLEERLEAATAQDLIGIFPESWILEGLETSRLASIEKKNKSTLHQFLQLELKSRLWYRSLPCHYFNKVCARLNSGDDETAGWLERECKTLQSGLFMLKEQIGGTPKLFLNERPAHNVTEDEVIEISE